MVYKFVLLKRSYDFSLYIVCGSLYAAKTELSASDRDHEACGA